MTRYAEKTAVSSERSKTEIERVLVRYGTDKFLYGWEERAAVVSFRLSGRLIRFRLPLPREDEFERTPVQGYRRDDRARRAAWEQAVRQRWRALLLIIKAKLEAVEAGVTTVESEFLSHTVLPDNRTVGEWLEPQVVAAYESGQMPELLPGLALPPERPALTDGRAR